MSSAVRCTSNAPAFSATRSAFVDPGIGKMSSPRASSHASANWAAVQPFSFASDWTRVARSTFFWKFSPWKRGFLSRQSSGARSDGERDLSGQEAAPERAVGDERDPELADRGEQLGFRIAAPQRVLSLQRRNRMHGVSAANGLRRRFGQAEIPHLAGGHELGHRADRLLDRRVRVDAVLVVDVDGVDAEPLQRRVARLAHVLRPAVDAEERAVLGADVAELRGEHHLVAAIANGPADQTLVGERAVDVGRVQEIDAEIDRAVNGRDRSLVIGPAVEVGHAHAAEPDRRNVRTVAAELSSWKSHALPQCACALPGIYDARIRVLDSRRGPRRDPDPSTCSGSPRALSRGACPP